jgi:hypothetical protein
MESIIQIICEGAMVMAMIDGNGVYGDDDKASLEMAIRLGAVDWCFYLYCGSLMTYGPSQ